MPHVVISDKIFLEKIVLEKGREIVVRSAGVSKAGAATCAGWWKLMGEEEGVAATTRIEGGVTMEKDICLYNGICL